MINLALTQEDMAIFARVESTRAKLVYADADEHDAAVLRFNRKMLPRLSVATHELSWLRRPL